MPPHLTDIPLRQTGYQVHHTAVEHRPVSRAGIVERMMDGQIATSHAQVLGALVADSDSEELQRQLRLKDDVIQAKDDVIRTKEEEVVLLGKRVKGLESEVGVLWERLGKMGEEKRGIEMKMALVQEEASHSLNCMVAAQRGRRREEGRSREMREQLELQVGVQAEELLHLRLQLKEEAQAHRDDVEIVQKQLRKMRAQLERAKGLHMMSTSQPSIPLHCSTLPTGSSPRRHQPLLHTVSDVPPSYYQSTGQATPPQATPTNHTSYQQAPATFHTGVTAFHGHLCYFSSFMTTDIHVYDTAVGAWHILPGCPVTNFGLEVVRGSVTTIGGRLVTEPTICTTQLFSLSQGGRGERGVWVRKLPSMKLARSQPATTSNSRLVIVAGGEVGDHKTFIADIEILLLETAQWTHVASSPLGNYSWLTAALCGEQLYLIEGRGVRERDNLHALHMGALIEELRDPVAQQQQRRKRGGLPWKQVRSAPVSNTTCVCAKGQLVAVGGIEQSGKSTNQIWAFDRSKDTWKTIGSLKSHRYRSLVGVTATGSLLVIGGLTKTNFTDQMEIFDSF